MQAHLLLSSAEALHRIARTASYPALFDTSKDGDDIDDQFSGSYRRRKLRGEVREEGTAVGSVGISVAPGSGVAGLAAGSIL